MLFEIWQLLAEKSFVCCSYCFCSLSKDIWINDLMSEEERILLTMVNYYHMSHACFGTINLPKSWGIFCWLVCLRINWEKTSACGVVAKLHLLWDPFPSRFTVVRKAALHLLFLTAEESVHSLPHHILLPFSGMMWKDICMEIILLQNLMHIQSCCNRLLQFCTGPGMQCPGDTPRALWALCWLLIAAVCTVTHDGCWLVGHLPSRAVSAFGTTLLQIEL